MYIVFWLVLFLDRKRRITTNLFSREWRWTLLGKCYVLRYPSSSLTISCMCRKDLPVGWTACTHPEGALYFFHDSRVCHIVWSWPGLIGRNKTENIHRCQHMQCWDVWRSWGIRRSPAKICLQGRSPNPGRCRSRPRNCGRWLWGNLLELLLRWQQQTDFVLATWFRHDKGFIWT